MLKLFANYIFVFLLIIPLLSSCDKSSNTIAHIDKQEFSIEDRKMLGAHLLETIKTDAEEYDVLNANAYREEYAYLNNLFHAIVLTKQVDTRSDFEWELIPLEDDEAFAFSLPGGKVLISTGFFKFIENEAELMSLMAHEIYYSDNDLLTAELKDEFGGVVLGDIILGNEINAKPLIEYLKTNSFSETNVLNADLLAIEMLCPFNYDVNSLHDLVARAKNQIDEVVWISYRPRLGVSWAEKIHEKSAGCLTGNGDRFESRYTTFKANLPE